MAIQDVAQAAYNTFPDTPISTPYGSYSLQVVMTAIAMAEDGGGNGSGDYNDPPGYDQYYCNGYASFGAWQINLPYNNAVVEAASGISSSDPCGQATWLQDYGNCAKAALAIYLTAGLGDWCTWGYCVPSEAGTGPYSQYLNQAQAAITAITPAPAPVTPPAGTVTPPSPWLLAAGIAAVAVGAGVLIWQWQPQGLGYGFAHHKPERKDHRVNPKWLFYTKPTEQDIAELTEPLSACTVAQRWKEAAEAAGERYVTDRNLPEGVEAYYAPAHDGEPDTIMESAAITKQIDKCKPYGVQVRGHEDVHFKTHNLACLPSYRGVTYSSEGHQVEEEEAELASFAAMVELGLPVEDYTGNVIPPGKLDIDWGLLKMYTHPDTFNNVKWATGLLVNAAQGDPTPFITQLCPAISGKVVT